MDSLEHPPVSHLICPIVRIKYYSNEELPRKIIRGNAYHLINNSYYDDNSSYDRHRLYPLYWCNNKENNKEYSTVCNACRSQTIGTTYYFCEVCDKPYHKECVESPPQIKSLYHPKHRLQLVTQYAGGNSYCKYCGSYCPRDGSNFLYHCFSCKFNLDPVCARKPPVLDYKKRHEHTLHYFPRQTDLVCDVCGVVQSSKPLIFVCLECDFVVHKNCIYLPFVIKIPRHDHRISFRYSSPYTNLLCGVCRRTTNKDYGKYLCTKGCIYAAHTRCATLSDVWDGKELEGEPEDEEHEIVSSFELIGDGIIHHFSHSHHLRLEREAADILYDDRIRCQACTLALNIGGSDVYKCINSNCDFVLHEECANLPRAKQHIALPFPLTLKVSHTNRYFICEFCNRFSFGFRYVHTNRYGQLLWNVDVRCATISEPFDHQCHIHPLFLTSTRWRYKTCSMCGYKRDSHHLALNCIECDFILCFACATLPYKARYKHDEHILTLSYVENVSLSWCEICEEGLCTCNESGLWLYACNVCEVTLHIACLLGKDAIYIKPAQNISLYGKIVSIVPNSGLTRPFCDGCKNRCQDKTMFVKPDGRIFCKRSELYKAAV